MKYNIVFKFLAVALCAVFLMTAVAGAFGIFAMTELGLYQRTAEEAYLEMLESHAASFAGQAARRYASGALGGCNTQMLDEVYDTGWYNSVFHWDQVGYVIRDGEGNALQTQEMDEAYEPASVFGFSQEGKSYIRVLNTMTQEEYNLAIDGNTLPVETHAAEYQIIDNLPEEGAQVDVITISYAGYQEQLEDEDGLGWLSYNGEGYPIFVSHEPHIYEVRYRDQIVGIKFNSMYLGLLYAADGAENVGLLYTNSQGFLQYEGIGHDVSVSLQPAETTEPLNDLEKAMQHGKTFGSGDNIYATPNTEGAVVGTVPFDAELEIIDEYTVNGADWLLTDLGWILLEHGNIGTPAVEQVLGMALEQTDIYALPGDYDHVMGTLEAGTVVDILYYSLLDGVQWAQIPEGWILLDSITTNVQPAEEAPAQEDMTFGVLKNPINLHQSPNDSSPVVGNLEPGTAVEIIRQVTVNEEAWILAPEGWIKAEYVELDAMAAAPAAEPAEPQASENRIKIHQAPGESTPVVGYLEPGGAVEAVQQLNVNGEDWILAPEGWIKAEYVDLEAMAAVAPAAEPAEPQGFAEPVELREAPNEDSPVIGYLGEGAWEIIQQETVNGEEWYLLAEGWVKAGAVAIPAPAGAAPKTEAPVSPVSMAATEETMVPTGAVEETVVPTEAVEETEAAVDATMETIPEDVDIQNIVYYDHDKDQWMVAEYVNEEMPAYTVEVALAENAFRYGQEWLLIDLAYGLKDQLPMIIGVSLLLFAVFAVYLCCAAGRKPGSTELRAGGLNRIPLDAYFCLAGGGAIGLVWLGFVGMSYFMDASALVALSFMAALCYGASLLVVGFCFACVAQIKTPGGFWWRNSLCGWAWKLLVLCLGGMFRACIWLEKRMVPVVVKLWHGLWKIVAAVARLLWKWTKAGYHWFLKGCTWAGDRIARFFAMLPLTWQWLLVGFFLVMWLFLAVAGRYEGLMLAWAFGAIAIVLYGSHCFGTLLESAKRMSKGDLDEKVDDKLMVGGFRDFANALNSLADVAVVAAQKQLKSERMKTELITNVSHDIKTPLTSIINYVDLLEKPHTPEEQEVYLEVLSRQSLRLKKLIEDLMEMSKASTGNLTVDIQKVDAAEAINQALGEFADKLDKARLVPLFRQPEEPVEMMADGRLVWRVMSNLLGNAVKYAMPGTRLYLDLTKVDGKVIISMKNISREELNVSADELLERFVRGDASRNTEGSGLGLNIAQSLMEVQKGQLQILVDGDLFKVTLIFPGA